MTRPLSLLVRPRLPHRMLTGVALSAALMASATHAQVFPRDRFRQPLPLAQADSFDGGFNFCRGWFNSGRSGDGGRWTADFPDADLNVSTRLSELTKASISRDAAGEPKHLVVRLTDDALFQCPFVMMTEVGAALISNQEASRLREYLLKGGFLWTDDSWGSEAWRHWAMEIGKVLPPARYPIKELTIDHPLFRTLFNVERVPQIPSLGWWLDTGRTSERGADSAVAHAYGIADADGRLMVLMTHNTDLGDSWEREGESRAYFHRFSVPGYALGLNVLLYAMTH